MAETEFSFETRLIGAEDVNWDSSGTNEKGTFTDDNGVRHDSTLINAGHIPLPSTTRALLDNKGNVAAGMEVLADRIGSGGGGSSSSLSEDTTVNIDSTQTASEIQSTIDLKPKNLGGHTLTFIFSEGFNSVLSSALVFDVFYNGFLVVDLNGITVSDMTDDIGSVFHLHDCFCKVEVKNGSITHTHSAYGIKAERCPCVYLTDLAFTGGGGNDDYAFCGIDADGIIDSCTYTSDKTKLISGIIAGLTEEHSSANDAHSDLFASKAPLVSPALTGTPTAPTATAGTNTTQIATTAFVTGAVSSKAPLASPALTGTPTAPTPGASSGTASLSGSASIATTSWIRYMLATTSSDGLMPASKNFNGYTKLPNGLILQWGQIAITSSSTNYLSPYWPSVFPSQCLWAAVLPCVGTNSNSTLKCLLYTYSKSQIQFWVSGATSGITEYAYYFGIGY